MSDSEHKVEEESTQKSGASGEAAGEASGEGTSSNNSEASETSPTDGPYCETSPSPYSCGPSSSEVFPSSNNRKPSEQFYESSPTPNSDEAPPAEMLPNAGPSFEDHQRASRMSVNQMPYNEGRFVGTNAFQQFRHQFANPKPYIEGRQFFNPLPYSKGLALSSSNAFQHAPQCPDTIRYQQGPQYQVRQYPDANLYYDSRPILSQNPDSQGRPILGSNPEQHRPQTLGAHLNPHGRPILGANLDQQRRLILGTNLYHHGRPMLGSNQNHHGRAILGFNRNHHDHPISGQMLDANGNCSHVQVSDLTVHYRPRQFLQPNLHFEGHQLNEHMESLRRQAPTPLPGSQSNQFSEAGRKRTASNLHFRNDIHYSPTAPKVAALQNDTAEERVISSSITETDAIERDPRQ